MSASAFFYPYLSVVTLWLTVVTLRAARAAPIDRVRSGHAGGTAAVAMGALPVLLYWDVTHSWWLHDDPSILRQVLEYPLLANLYDPIVWRAYSAANFTPLLPLSFSLDVEIFGLDPVYFYVHQLAAFAAAAAFGYLLLTRFLLPIFALLVILWVVSAPPAAELAEALMTRHYIEGLAALLAAFVALSRGVATGGRFWIWLGAACYLIACLAKEVFVPAILLFPFLLPDWRDWRAWQRLVPFAVCAALYTLGRVHMLGTTNVFAGYGDLHGAASVAGWEECATALGAQLGLDNWWKLAIVLLLCVLALWSAVRQREHRLAGFLLVGLVAAWAPLIPLFPDFASRNLLMPAVWLFAVAGLGLQRSTIILSRGVRWAVVLPPLAATMLILSAGASAAAWEPRRDAVRARAEWGFIMYGDPAATLVFPMFQPWYYDNVGWLRQHHGDGASGPAVCYSPCLCAREMERDYYHFALGAVDRYRPDLRMCPELINAAMRVALRYDSQAGELHWELSPKRDGRWLYARVPMLKRSPIPASGSTPYLLKHTVRLQFFFESEAGWTTRSAVLTLDPAEIDSESMLRLAWSRGR